MKLSRSYLIFFFLCTGLFFMVQDRLNAQSSTIGVFSEELADLKQAAARMNQQVLVLLKLIDEYEKAVPPVTTEVVKIIRQTAMVRETNLENSPVLTEVAMNEEYAILERRNEWYKILTEDGREGWIYESDIQLIKKQAAGNRIDAAEKASLEANALLKQAGRFKTEIDQLHASATKVWEQIDGQYAGMARENQQVAEAAHESARAYQEKIQKYFAYAERFFAPYRDMVSTSGGPAVASKVLPGDRFEGTARIDIGQSNYNGKDSYSANSRKIGFDGVYQINSLTKANLNINHQNEVMQTPYSNTSVNTGISARVGDKVNLGGNIGYTDYKDKETDINSFGMFNAGVNLAYDAAANSRLTANIGLRNKAFESMADKNFTGVTYAAGMSFAPSDQQSISIQLQGNSQVSDADYLRLNQINPQFRYRIEKDEDKTFAVGFDVDLIAYGATNNANNYQKFSADFQWGNKREKKSLTKKLDLSAKLFPTNTSQNYFRFGYVANKRKGSVKENKTSSTTFTTMINAYLDREDMFLADYLDIRFDNSRTGSKSFLTFNIFNRLWNNFIKTDSTWIDHVLDAYLEVGPYFRNKGSGDVKLSNLKIGVVIGGHVFYNFDDKFFIRNGNSLRGGLTAGGTLKIYRGSITFAGTFERSLIIAGEPPTDPETGMIAFDDLLVRKPATVQFRLEYRQPIARNWDVHFSVNTYNIRTDATFETSNDPIDKRSNLRVFGGLIYRFAL